MKNRLPTFSTLIIILVASAATYFFLWKTKISNFNDSQYQKYYQVWEENLPLARTITNCRKMLDVKKDSIVDLYKNAVLSGNSDSKTNGANRFYLEYYEKLRETSNNLYDLTYQYDLGYPEYETLYIENVLKYYNPIEFKRIQKHRLYRLSEEINKLEIRERQELQSVYCPKIENLKINEQNKPILCVELTKYEISENAQNKPRREDFEFEEEYLVATKDYDLQWERELSSCN